MSFSDWDLSAWRKYRDKDLRSEWGWLTLVGLSWLAEGKNTIGSDIHSTILLPKVAEQAGILVLKKGRVYLDLLPDGEFKIDGIPLISRNELISDAEANPTELRIGDYSLTVIKRSGQLAVRVRDRLSPTRLTFGGLQFYPRNPSLEIKGHFSRYESPLTYKVPTAVGREEEEKFVGEVEFIHQNKTYKIQAQERNGGNLFFTFRDTTSGKSTYGAGRFLLCPTPTDGLVDLDFNRSYNPPCSFTPWATCSLPHPDNRLDFAVEAGELGPEVR